MYCLHVVRHYVTMKLNNKLSMLCYFKIYFINRTRQRQSLHIDRTHKIFKHRLNKYKPRTDEKEDEEEYDQDEEYCGSCYGAGDDDGECCNICDDVKRACQRKGGWLFKINAISDIMQQTTISK